jgi:hypothetical protein
MRNLKRIQDCSDFPRRFSFSGSNKRSVERDTTSIHRPDSAPRSAGTRARRLVGTVPAQIAMNCQVSHATARTFVNCLWAKPYDILANRTLLDCLRQQNTSGLIGSRRLSDRTGVSCYWCLVTLHLRSWSPGYSRSSPPKGGTPTYRSAVDDPLVWQAGVTWNETGKSEPRERVGK